jgi:alpha-D-ribose 1-methylphosphonate 5-triphosphate diphosphatase PhnM
MSKHIHTPVKKMEEKKEMKEDKKEIKVEKKEEKKMEKKEEEEKKTYSLKERNEILNKLKEKGISVPARGRGMKTSELDEKLNKL